jgi:RNA methyltransferase, TrmH family
LTKHWQKLIRSLHQKKYRELEGLFLIEGRKNILEALRARFPLECLFLTDTAHAEWERMGLLQSVPAEPATAEMLEKVGTLQTNDAAIAVAIIPRDDPSKLFMDSQLVLDGVRDPGNLGTILRIADWYGIQAVVCSTDCVDAYNPKVIAASMGAFCRMTVQYRALETYLPEISQKMPVYGAVMEGENVHQLGFASPAAIVMGNESNGIREELYPHLRYLISIPRFGGAESLNVAVATAIICDNFRRNIS